ncbi:MAG: YdiU family protein [Pirellulaceae bacterium]|nr:YdiU family protein [Pirellulaceae bacterium]
MSIEVPQHRFWDVSLETDMGWRLESTYLGLPETFYSQVLPEPVARPQLVKFNTTLANSLGLNLDQIPMEKLANLFSGNQLFREGLPFAQAYAGHQYGGFTMLGDGRAVMLSEHRDPDGRLWDIQLKGAGRTPYSRNGDGRAALGPMLREYLISEAMYALGIPTTRSLAVVATGERVHRERPLPGAVLTRIAISHLRVGTFEYANCRNEPEELATLADYAIARHFPELTHQPDRMVKFLRSVMQRQAKLVAQWMAVGFVHGVMNTDNVSIAGETIDYGPCAFMNAYDPATVFSSIDRHGRYAYGNQPRIANWNMARFAESLLPIISDDRNEAIEVATTAVHEFPHLIQADWLSALRLKLGLHGAATDIDEAHDHSLINDLLDWMKQNRADFTNTFRTLAGDEENVGCAYWEDQKFCEWVARWETRVSVQGGSVAQAQERMKAVNPVVIPRNHRVEEVLANANRGDFQPFDTLLELLRHPFERRSTNPADYAPPPPGTDACYQTFCGT